MSEIFNGGVIVETILPVSVPSGGSTGQALVKKSGASYDLEWKTITGGGGSGNGDMLKSVYDPDNDGKIDYVNQVSNKPTLGTASSLNAPSVGNAGTGEVVKGSDTRLSDARTPLSHTHSISDVIGLQSTLDGKGSVTITSIVPANGFSGSVANPTLTPAITLTTTVNGLLKGNGTALSAVVSGTDIKTINGNSIIGSGDLVITGGGGGSGTVTNFSFTNGAGFTGSVANATTTPTLSLVLQNATTSQSGQLTNTDWNTFNSKQATLVSGTTIKTVNGTSILGSGDIAISGGAGGTVTSASVVTANGLAGSVANATTTPAITLTTTVTGLVKGNGTSFSAATAGTDYLLPTGSGASLTGITASQVSGAASLASPTFTGVPLSTTAAVDTNTTQIATTAYVVAQGYLKSSTAASTYATIASQGTAAAGVLTTSTTDTTVGRVAKVGDYGIGTAPVSSDNWNTVVASGKYRNTLTSATGVPEATAGLLMTNTYIDANTATQMAWNTSSGAVYTRNKTSGSWGSWTAATSGGVTSVSVVSANGLGGSVATATTTPAITLTTSITGILKGNGTAISAVVSGTDLKTINGTSIIGSGDIVISGGGGSGTVTSASVVSANGFAGSVATATTTPAITISTSVTGLLKGNGTAVSAATSGTDYLAPANVTSSSVDVTAGRLLKVGDYGLGSVPVTNNNWDTLVASGRYTNTSTSAVGIPVALAGLIVNHTYIDANTATEVAWDVLNNQMYVRRKTSGTWSSWSAGASSGSIVRSVIVTSGATTVGSSLSTDYVYLVAGAHTITLATAVGNTNQYTIKNNHTVAITVNTTSSQTIDGTTTITINPQGSVTLISTGSNWSVI